MRWIRLQLGQIPYFQQLRQKQVTSWVRLLCRAATEDSNVSQLLPRFTSLANPPADVMENIEYVVATMQMLLGPLPVTDVSLRQHPTSYLSWLHLVLTDFQAAQGTPYAPKLFSMLPQTGHHTSFIKISTTSLSKKGCKEVTSRPDYWWSRFTNCISLSRWTAPTSDRLRFHTFHDEVQTDGVSVSVLMFQPHPAQSPSSSKHSRHTPPCADPSVLGHKIQLWLMETPASAAAVAKATQAHQLCLFAETLATTARSSIQMSSALADCAVHARQPWTACLSL